MSFTIPQGTASEVVFGGGLFGKAINGTARITALSCSLVGLTMAAEVALRTAGAILGQIISLPGNDSLVMKGSKLIEKAGARPYSDRNQYPIEQLVVKAIGFSALGILGNEATRNMAGEPPALYNKVLSLLGPFRLDGQSYWSNFR